MEPCPGCGISYGPGTTTDPYKHLVQCLHLPNVGVQQLLHGLADKEDPHSQRAKAALREIQSKG